MGSRRRARQVEIFNFSFLDILACTIGLLIFILVMIFLLQSSTRLTDYKKIIQNKMKVVREIQRETQSATVIEQSMKAQLSKMKDARDPKLLRLLRNARQNMMLARENSEVKVSELSNLDAEIESQQAVYSQETVVTLKNLQQSLTAATQKLARLRQRELAEKTNDFTSHMFVRLAKGKTGGVYTIMNVLCAANGLSVLKVDKLGKASIASVTDPASIGDNDSAFQQALVALRSHRRPLVIFWINTGGISAFRQAKDDIPSGIKYGYEPALHHFKYRIHSEGK